MSKRIFIVEFMGIDGSGKTTITKTLNKELNNRMIESLVVDPLNEKSEFTKRILQTIHAIDKRESQFNEQSEAFLAYYFSISLFIRFNELIKGHSGIILCDRYYNSHYINQKAFGVDLSSMKPLFDKLPNPDLIILLDVPISTALDRLNKRGNVQIHENESYLNRSRSLYLELIHKKNGHVVDACQPVEAVISKCLQILESSVFCDL